jgi:hypothetical protein
MSERLIQAAFPRRGPQASPAEILAIEHRRLLYGLDKEERTVGIGTWPYWFYCDGNADLVLQRVKQLLALVNEDTVVAQWPDDDGWLRRLPEWFLQADAAADTRSKAPHVRSDRPSHFQDVPVPLPFPDEHFSPLEWTWAMMPGETPNCPDSIERFWYWWDAVVVDSNRIEAAIDHLDMPVTSPYYRWMFRAAGARAFYDYIS